MGKHVTLNVDGQSHELDLADPTTPLLYLLRDELGLNNPHFGCGLSQCGACTVHVNGTPMRSCVLPAAAADGATITTLAGIGTAEHPHPVQQAFIDEQAFFCGYCMNGWVMTAVALVKEKPRATDAEIREAFSGLKCRCGSHMSIIRAVKRLTEAA
ncbi:MAG: (2Fe-2S)-binding protein [Acidocella sp. 20-57-95]|nr:MAG: (2Fe-2S)-binding protein [Acidocella sp. 20-57-95]OYV59662.1 MAG: (2Fe-2S)-binding protein [Acidocella sp. 21-58-7]HQT63520.1 (2Fe-2S)-binding protein [Acidocella sp.]HQU03308.1 (2Fe-2S)-binding protein [Acidocella sp.]